VNHPEALCLDGSPSAFYYYPGNQTSDLIIYFYGGGFCVDGEGMKSAEAQVNSCEDRKNDFFGSTS